MSFISRIIKAIQKKGLVGFFWAAIADIFGRLEGYLNNIRDRSTSYKFINKSKGQSNLIVVLAGYKSYLWPFTLESIYKYQSMNTDVCIVSPGKYSKKLEQLCENNGWSYLSVKRNSPGVALNQAIRLHPNADYIYKLDEDILISENFFENLKMGYELTSKKSLLEPGFVAPVLNINGISYSIFLKEFGLEKEYQEKFGNIIKRCGDLPVHNNPETAWWIWKNTLPFQEKAKKLSENEFNYSVCSTRFSIGAILFRREFIEQVGGFKSAWHSGVLGVDEDELCRDCTSHSRPIYMIHNTLAGHFSFYPQESYMKTKLSEMSLLDPKVFH
ncbi:glycosyltransferase family protein [Acinetobacter faecalis]|uniref:Glycosyltransferase family 2 protein n=1 Tax=Acinetobacter faecalis TaxID=2665161 RepID=A0ABU5GGK2_9GAMM|nr:hypothetical protein [Acinetobacter faecalis]MDY6549684.1 hypothetical protein [Acinetobacter faecalis]